VRPDVETRILRLLPELLLAGTVPPVLAALLVPNGPAGILALALITAWWFALLPLALSCLIVCVMKGPRRISDPHRLPD